MSNNSNIYGEVEEKVKVEDWGIIFRLWKFVKPYLGLFIISIILILISAGLDLLPPFLTKVAIDNYISNDTKYDAVIEDNKLISYEINSDGKYYFTHDENGSFFITDGDTKIPLTKSEEEELQKKDISGVTTITFYLILTLIGIFFINYGQVIVTSFMGLKITHDLRMFLFKKLLKKRMRFFDTNPSGRLSTRVANDTQNITEFFTNVITSIIKDVVLLAGIIVIMLYLSIELGVISLLILPVIIVAILVFRYFDRIAYRKVRAKVAVINAFLAEHISGISVIKLFNQEKRKKKEFDEINNDHLKSTMEQMKVFAVFRPLMDLLYYLAITVILWYGAKGITTSTIEFGVLYAFVSYIDMFFRPLKDIAEKYDIVQNALASSEKVFKLIDEDEENYNEEKDDSDDRKGSVEFKNVWLAYDNKNFILKDISFKVSPKEKIAIVGETGAGKTSIISILNGLYKIQKGDVIVDGKSIYDYNLKQLRKSIGIVIQDVFLFSGNIIDNIRLFDKSISRDEVVQAAKYVYADYFIERLSDGYDTEIIEGAATLSAGERQLIALARAVLFNTKILVLDEATSNIDSQTEYYIQKALERISQTKTVITIAHRLSTIKSSNRILVMHKGKLVEEGNHLELLEKKGIYADLYKLQYENEV